MTYFNSLQSTVAYLWEGSHEVNSIPPWMCCCHKYLAWFVVYDELTINERQKNDPQFSSMLDCVRCGCPTQETVDLLRQRVIQVPVSDKFWTTWVREGTCLLIPQTKSLWSNKCKMLRKNGSKIHEIDRTDELDESAGNRKLTRRLLSIWRNSMQTAIWPTALKLAFTSSM